MYIHTYEALKAGVADEAGSEKQGCNCGLSYPLKDLLMSHLHIDHRSAVRLA